MAPKNNLSIRLTESVVFLRGSAETTVTGRRTTREAQPAMLRGLLTLTLDKPTKISSIEITLEGKTQTAWPEGVGARKLEVTEEHEIFSATTVFFRSGKLQTDAARRTASIGPGLAFDHEDIEDDNGSNEDHEHRPRFPGTSTPPSPWIRGARRRVSMDPHILPRSTLDDIPTPPYSPPGTRPGSFRATESSQSISNMANPHLMHREGSWVSNYSSHSRIGDHIEPSHVSRENSESSSSSLADLPLSRIGSHEDADSSLYERSRSRGRPRVAAVHANTNTNTTTPNPSRTPSLSTAPSPSVTFQRPPLQQSASSSSSANINTNNSPPNSNSNSNSNSNPPSNQPSFLDGDSHNIDSSSSSPHRDRGRRHARFSLAMVSNVLLDAVKERVRSSSPRPRAGKERALTPAASRDHSPDGSRSRTSRAPSRLRDGSVDPETERGRRVSREESGVKQKEKERSTLGRITDALGLDAEGPNGDGDGWKEFRKGTYTYPISFAIPGDSPPSLQCDFGTVSYRLKATAHRPGAFTHRMTASHSVTLIASPGEDDVDESDNIVIQREWDSQMHYIIVVSGRAFPIGSSIPIHITFMPIAKIKIFRITAVIEEKVEYFTQFKRVARAEAVKKFELLTARYPEKDGPPVLPMTRDYSTSPLNGLVDAPDESEAASALMGPGPWSIQSSLQLPKSCAKMHFTNKHKRSNIAINHVLKIVFRVERGDDSFLDAKTGQRKHFDIVVQTPLHILSCRCNPEWTALPRYSCLASEPFSRTQTCPCIQKRGGNKTPVDESDLTMLPAVASNLVPSTSGAHHTPFHTLLHSLESHTESPITEESTPPSPPLPPPDSIYTAGQPLSRLPSDAPSELESLYRRNTQFARLVAGEESEAGDPPPQYERIASLENPHGAEASAAIISVQP